MVNDILHIFEFLKKNLIFGPFLGPLGAQPNFQQTTIFWNGEVFDNLFKFQETNPA